MLSKKILSLFILLSIIACAKERYVEDYPNVIPPIIKEDHPEVYKVFKSRPEA